MDALPPISEAFSLCGRTAVVTGAGSGLGRAAARMLAQAGARLVLADIDEAGMAETARLIEAAGGHALAVPTDVTRPEQLDALAEAALALEGRLDCWVNSAGIAFAASVLEATPAGIERIFAINIHGSYWGSVAAAKAMRQCGHGGSIINVSSVAGDGPVPTLCVYGMTKAAVNQMTRGFALELGADRIRVNAIVPGFIDTPINAIMYRNAEGEPDPDLRARLFADMAALAPIGRTGEPADIALAALYLASDASSFVTGQLLKVSGGV